MRIISILLCGALAGCACAQYYPSQIVAVPLPGGGEGVPDIGSSGTPTDPPGTGDPPGDPPSDPPAGAGGGNKGHGNGNENANSADNGTGNTDADNPGKGGGGPHGGGNGKR